MDHSKMPGMDGMQGMDHSKMPGMEPKQPPATTQSQQMDHSKMPGMEPKQQPVTAPESKEAMEVEMKKTSDEMKKLSEELKAKSKAAKPAEPRLRSGPAAAPSSEAIIYTCTMHPEVQQPNPGKCPKCGMTLVKQESSHTEKK